MLHSIPLGILSFSSGGFEVDKSALFNSADDEYLTAASGFGTPTNADIGTISLWFKRANLGGSNVRLFTHGGVQIQAYLKSDNALVVGNGTEVTTTQLFRDPHAWYHLVIRVDTSQGTAANRVRVYVNGSQIESFSASSYPSEDADIFTSGAWEIGRWSSSTTQYTFEGYMAEFCYCDGQSLAPTSFGELDDNNVWRPIDPSSNTFGNNGFYLNFASSGGSLGDDAKGSNDFTNTNSVTQSTDTCTNNSAILSPLWTDATLSNGNLKVAATGDSYQWAISTLAIPSSGKWTFEAQSSNIDGTKKGFVGICQMGNHNVRTGNNYIYGIDAGTGDVVKNTSSLVDIGSPAGTSLWRIEYDADNDNIKIFDDDAEVFPASTGVSNTVGLTGQNSLHFFVAPYGSGADFTVTFKGLSDTPTSSYKELTTDNLYSNATPAIEDVEKHFVHVLRHGNETERDITTVIPSGSSIQFDPDLVWGKDTDNGSYTWRMFDILRGSADSYEVLESNSTAAETVDSNGVRQFTPNGSGKGFEIGTGTALNEGAGPDEIIAYLWKGAGSASTLDGGSVDSSVTANTTSGFSAGTFTPPGSGSCTVAHGLGGTPDWIIVKPRDETESWVVWHSAFCATSGNSNRIFLETTATSGTGDAAIPTVTSTLFTCPDDSYYHSCPFIFYAWRSIAGFSKFGKYEGNNSSSPSQNNIDGAITFLDFKPALVILKNIDGGEDWFAFDNKREGWNADNNYIKLNVTDAENTSNNPLDLGSNYFKMRYNDGAWNHAQTYIYCAWAKHPLAGESPSMAV